MLTSKFKFPQQKKKETRDRVRFWIELIGIPATLASLVFLGAQVYQQNREAEIRTILDIEDSERFINQLALNKPELALLMKNAEDVIDVHAIIVDCELNSIDIFKARLEGQIEITSGDLRETQKEVREECKQRSPSENHIDFFIGRAEGLLHLLPVSHIVDYYEISGRVEKVGSFARFRALRALIEQLRARVDTAGFIMLQEFEKMYRVCGEGIMEEEFWRGSNAFETRMYREAQSAHIQSILNNKNLVSGFHPRFISYLKDLLEENDPNNLSYEFKNKYCIFKSEYSFFG